MQCEEVRQQLTDYVIDQIEESARSAIRQHLAACEDCKAETEGLKGIWTTMGSIPAAEPSTDLRSRFEMMLEAYHHGLDQAPAKQAKKAWWQSVNSWLSGWWPRQPALQMGMSVALLIIGVVIGRQFYTQPISPGVQPGTEVTQLRSELFEMRQMIALSLMQQQSASERIKGVNWSYQLQKPGSEVLSALLDTLMHDSNVNVRLATVDALRQFGDQPVVRQGLVVAMARQESPMVQIALIDLAADLREKESIPVLRRLTEDQNINGTVRDRAQLRLAELE